jgi:drug/metabolite transporter (DMT)-like permease
MSRRLQADLSLALCTLFWGATFVVVTGALAHASTFAFLAARFSVASLLMVPVFWKSLRGLHRAEVWAGAQIGFFMFSGYALQTLGLLHTTPSKSAFITGSSVVLVPVLMALFWARRVNAWVWLGAGATAAGLYFITVPAGRFAGFNAGDILTLGAAVLFAVHIILVGSYSLRHSVGALSILQVATTALLSALALGVLALGGWQAPHFDGSRELFTAIAITAVLATAVAFSVQVWAQRFTSPSHAAILFSLEPVFAALTSYLVVHERLGKRALAGAALVLLGILIAELKGPAQAAADSPGPVTESA